jgi:hypothetical protein
VPARKTPPTLRRHKPSKQSVVTLNGRDFYLGHWSDGQKQPPLDVRTAYDALIAEWLVNGRRPTTETPPAISVSELLRAFWDGHATLHYRHPDGTPAFQLPTSWFLNSKPRWMSVRRASPRPSTILPGGGSLARAKYLPNFAITIRECAIVRFGLAALARGVVVAVN